MTETLATSGPVMQATDAQSVDSFKVCGPAGASAKQGPSVGYNQHGLFQVAYNCAWTHAYGSAMGWSSDDTGPAQAAYKIMLREGLGLVRGNCADFFRRRGDRQQLINFGRDVVAFGGTTAGAIIGLTGGSALALSIIALSGAALYGGIDVYTKNFLFGVENIESVRTLTMTTLNGNSDELLARTGTLSFQNVADAIMDNQEICKPASIAAAVRIKLRGGTADAIVAAGTGGGTALSDRAVVARISEQVVGWTGAILSDGQLALVCWATTPEGSTKLAEIKKLLGDAFANGPGTGGWGSRVSVVGYACQQELSDAKLALLDRKIREFKAAFSTLGGGTNTESMVVGTPMGGSLSRGTPSGGPGLLYAPMTVR